MTVAEKPITDIDVIKESVSISDIIETYTNNRIKNRRSFNILCPIHGENNPSCTVWTDTSRFKCWSCQASGDQLDLLAGTLDISLSEAIKTIRRDLIFR